MLKKISTLLLLICIPFALLSCEEKETEPSNDTIQKDESSNSTEKDKTKKEEKGDTVKIFYYTNDSKEIFYVEEKIDKETEGGVAQVDDLLRKSPNSTLIAPLSSTSFIQEADAMSKPDIAILKYTKDFINDQKSENLDEELALKCIAYTYCDLFKVNNALFLLDNNDYKSSKFRISEKNPLKVDLSNTKEFKE